LIEPKKKSETEKRKNCSGKFEVKRRPTRSTMKSCLYGFCGVDYHSEVAKEISS